MQTFLSVLGFVVFAAIVVRFLPIDTVPFHEDPAAPDARKQSEVRLIGQDAPRFPASADDVLEAFARIALSDWGVRLVEGNVDEGMMTFVARSKVFGFRDFITVKAVDEGRKAKLSVFARPRFDVYDWDMNTKRLDRWLGELQQTLTR